MNKLLLSLLVTGICLFVVRADAQDSESLIGNDGKIAVATFEHRDGASSRATEVTLIYGQNLLQGQLKNTNSGSVTLKVKDPIARTPMFTGKLSVDYQTKQMTLKGKITMPPSDGKLKIDTKFKCTELRPVSF